MIMYIENLYKAVKISKLIIKYSKLMIYGYKSNTQNVFLYTCRKEWENVSLKRMPFT